ncbi:drug resistance transporter, EmrB/QacA subfamily [Actinokineospora alba]|uniref:Drug resistance transporter, EmrB/QacA subfamily n=1 Tax=Actinokineospora alba TaxID=504798 RepID=A0A1H0IG20_9PSEU|nr:MFS transporter [Actinokineospora alba]TDP70959.1 EmrB/QacA subfamily drug resistance transporter [Actinokineospora alba]SDI89179.1 drug resistance transporter, EmrB/QacA subfamily [Actinokineospora alba]SDO30364.1 drug resistance transporter, EmrB/QacA subfamily [Actinokineospora alba]
MSIVDTAPALMTSRQRLTLILLLTASFTLAVDFSILNVALPVIGAEVGFSLENLQWIATAFALCAAGFTLLFGRVADLFGRRRLFLAGMALLGVASLIGGLATTPALLLTARVAQGLATAAVTPAALSLLTTSFPEGSLRDKALGLNGALMAAGFTTGAILGGLLTDLLSWRWAFFINIPVAAFVLIAAPTVLAESKPERRARLDVPGAVTVTLGLLAIVFGLTTAGERSWSDPRAFGALAVGVVLLGLFWLVEQRVAEPLVPVAILRRGTVAWGNLAGLLAFVTETSLVFLLTLYLQKVLGYTPLATGLSFAVLGIGTVVGGVIAPKVIARVGTKRAIVTAFGVQAAATLPLAFLGTTSAWVLPLLVLTFAGGVANLVAIVGFMVTATSGLPDGEQGLATGLATMSQQVGITMGIPIMSAIVTARAHGDDSPAAVLDGVSTAIFVNAGLCVLTGLLVAAFLRDRRGQLM